jgi:hypothetical protein
MANFPDGSKVTGLPPNVSTRSSNPPWAGLQCRPGQPSRSNRI